MRYIEQLKYSRSYHWGLFCEVWDLFTLYNWRWFIVGLLVVFSLMPIIVMRIMPPSIYAGLVGQIPRFVFDTDYYWFIKERPFSLWVFNYIWVTSSGFKPLQGVLCSISMGLLLGAYLREK